MSNTTLRQAFKDIADAIRAKGVTGTMSPLEMPSKVASITSDKYGISMDNFFGDVDANGVLQVPTNTSLQFVSDEILSIQNPASLNFLKGNTQLTKIDLSNLTTVGDQALATVFQNCTALAEVNLPSLSSIGDYGMVLAFSGCTSLTHVTLPAITSLTAGSGQLNQTFKGCTSLLYVSIPNLTSVGAGGMMSTFQGCTGLKYLDLSSLSSIQQQGADEICSGCTALQFVDFRNATAVPVNTGSSSSRAKQVWFPNTNDTFKVIVPDALYSSWISNYWWETMASQIVKASEYPIVMTPYTGYDNTNNN